MVVGSMPDVISFRAPRHRWRARVAVLLACVLATPLVWAEPARASFAVQVQVISHELHNGQCMDGPVFCNRPELLVQASIDTNDGKPAQHCRGPINPSFDNIVEDQTICGTPVTVEGDFTVTVALIDDDAGTDDALDIAPGDAWAWSVRPPFRTGRPDQRSITTSGGPSWMRFTVLVTPVAAVLKILSPAPGPGGTPPVFDPTIGERLSFRVARTVGTRTRFEVTTLPTDGSPRQTWNVFEGVSWGSGVTVLDWDGSLAPSGSSQPLPDGRYELSLTDIGPATNGGGARVALVVEIRRATVPEIRLADVRPDPAGWDFRNGPVGVRGSITVDGRVHLEVLRQGAGLACVTGVRTTEEVLRGRGPVEFGWDGRGDNGELVAAGRYCLRGELRTTTGLVVRSAPRVFEVRNPAAGLMAWVFPDPIIPIEAAGPARVPPTLTARAVDGQHRDRPVATIAIEVAAAGPAGTLLAFAPRTIVTCTQVNACSAVLPPDLAAASAIAYRVSAGEADGTAPEPQRFVGGWRITDLNPPPNRTWRASVPATVTEAGEIAPTTVDTRFDVVYYPGTGNDLADVNQARHFAAQVAGNIAHLLGMGTSRATTTFAAHPDAMAFIVSPQRPAVAVSLSGKTCGWSGLVKVSYGDAHGVLHNTTCRDVSYASREYSSNSPVVDWHELHHALFDESDEYCCDGGYYDDRINVYPSLERCRSSTAAPPAGCAQITDGSAVIGWWRAGPAVNVMIDHSTMLENPDDVRAADAAFGRCGRRQC